jgi:hypothetical protein
MLRVKIFYGKFIKKIMIYEASSVILLKIGQLKKSIGLKIGKGTARIDLSNYYFH